MKKSVKATVCVMAAATAITAIPMVSAQAADEKVTVNFWHSMGGDNEKILQSVVDTYNASQDKIEVVPEYQGNYYDSIGKPSSVSSVVAGSKLMPVIKPS